MKIVAQIAFTPPVTVYDSVPSAEGESGVVKAVKNFFNPVVQVQGDDGTPIYSTGDFYTPWGLYVLLGLGTVGIVYLLTRK